MNKVFALILVLFTLCIAACSSPQTEEEKIESEENEKVDELIKSDQERIDSFKRANGL